MAIYGRASTGVDAVIFIYEIPLAKNIQYFAGTSLSGLAGHLTR